MHYTAYRNWVSHYVGVKGRLKNICIGYILFLMVSVRKHSLDEASHFFEHSKSGYSKFLKNHVGLAVQGLSNLSRKQAKRIAKALVHLADNKLPWKIGIVIDSTIQKDQPGIRTMPSDLTMGRGLSSAINGPILS